MKEALYKIKESPLFWPVQFKGSHFLVLDETKIPSKVEYIKVNNVKEAVNVIRQMKTRAFGQFLVVLNTFLVELNNSQLPQAQLFKKIKKIETQLNNSRPTFPFSEVTAVIVHWAQEALEKKEDFKKYVSNRIHGYLNGIRMRRLERVQKIAALIKDTDSILTHCNVSGELAMAAYICQQQKKRIHFFATETRPYLQGAKLTCWELKQMGADVTLVSDNAIGSLMADGLITKVIVGSDRSCANGDIANKIGTYQIAVLASEFEIPFYVLTQPSNKIKKGQDIPIEIRDSKELLEYAGKKIVDLPIKGFYPGFDIVPNNLITEAIAIETR